MSNSQDAVDAAAMRDKVAIAESATTTGNMVTMYEALVRVKRLFDGRLMWQPDIRKAPEAVDGALAAPPRNCDVGTAEEQYKRFKKFCFNNMGDGMNEHRCSKCPLGQSKSSCHFDWTQMPYE